ncbi:MAG: carboxypeptidase-like regulatory domain-containing protein [Vicinamibacterales bacterium]
MTRQTVLLICAAAVSLAAGGQAGVRDARPLASSVARTAELTGTILNDASPAQPVNRAVVTVTGTEEAEAWTDERGQFAIKGLPAGRYTLRARKAGLVSTAYGAKRYDRPGTTIVLADGQRVDRLNVVLSRGAVISGTITDQGGDPAFDVEVRAMQYRPQLNGERTPAPVQTTGASVSNRTDDQGEYRLYGLPPGDYLIVATPRSLGPAEIRVSTDEEIRAALAEMQRPVVGGRGGVGATTPQTPARPAAPPTGTLAAVYYPGTPSASAATAINVSAGDERSGIDVRLQVVRTARVEGQVLTPGGVPPESVQLMLVANASATTPSLLSGALMNRATVAKDGHFSLSGISPGQYLISARTGGGPMVMQFNGGGGGTATMTSTVFHADSSASGQAGPPLWGQADVVVDGQDVTDVVVTLQPGLTLSGRVVFSSRQGLAAPADLSSVRVSMTPMVTSGGAFSPPQVTVDAAGRLTATGITPGRYRIFGGFLAGRSGAASTPGAAWNLLSAMVGDRDALDVAFDVLASGAPSEAVLTFTDVTQEISGRLQDASGVAAPDYTVVVFPAERGLWESMRRIKSTRPGTDGRFTITDLPPGTYRIAALTDMAASDLNDPSFLDGLVGASLPVTLALGEKKIQDFSITSGR